MYPRLILITFFSLALFLININKPFVGHHDFNSSFFSIIARNISQNSIVDTKLGQIDSTGIINSNNFSYYTHNVPLYPWVLATDFVLFGVGQVQARALSVIYSIGILVIVFFIAKKIYTEIIGYLAGIFFSLSAMMIYFSSSVFPDLQGIFLTLAAYLAFLYWLEKREGPYFLAYLVLSFLSYLTIWGSYFIAPFIVGHYLLNNKVKVKNVVVMIALPIVCFCLFLIHNYMLQGVAFFADIKNSFLSRTNIVESVYSVSITAYIKREMSLFVAYYSKFTAVLVLLWFFVFCKGLVQKSFDKSQLKLIVLFLWGASYVLFFRQASYIHDYFLIYLAPFVAIAAAKTTSSFIQGPVIAPLLKRNSLLITLILLVPFLQFFLIKNFAFALLRSNNNTPGYELGKILDKETGKQDSIVVLSREFGSYFDVFVKFYSNRRLTFADLQFNDYESVKQNYTYAVIIEGRQIDLELKELLLTKNQNMFTQNSFTIIKI